MRLAVDCRAPPLTCLMVTFAGLRVVEVLWEGLLEVDTAGV